jgi:hypothetical protein
MSKKIKISAAARRLGQQGTKAWKKIKQTHIETYEVWMQLAKSFQSGRTWAMAEAKTNNPKGAAYNQAMGDWLAEFELTDFDPSDRARLLNYLEHRDEIEAYFTAAKVDFKSYHPATLFKKWKRATAAPKPPKAEGSELEPLESAPTSASKNPLLDFNAGQIVDFILALKASTVKAIVHDLMRETTNKRMSPLVWKENGSGITGYSGCFEAKTATGEYTANPTMDMLNGMKFGGYSTSYYTRDAAGDRVIKVNGKNTKARHELLGSAQTADKAKALAEAHYANS